MRNWLRVTMAIFFMGMILAGCNDLPKPDEKNPEPTVSTQWFWQPSVWETNGPADQWFINVIKNTSWIMTGAQNINNSMQGNYQALDWSVARQTWDTVSSTVRIFVPFNFGGTGILVEMAPHWNFFPEHTVDIVDASHVSFRFDSSNGGTDITGLIRINPNATPGKMTVRYSKSTNGALIREVLSPSNATTGEIQSLSSPTIGVASIIVTPVCTQSIVVTAPPTCTTSSDTPGTCRMAANSGTPTTCSPTPTTPPTTPELTTQNCANKKAAVADAWSRFRNASLKVDAINIGIGGGCLGAAISWAIGAAPVGVTLSIPCLTALLNRASAIDGMEDARKKAQDLEAEYSLLCSKHG